MNTAGGPGAAMAPDRIDVRGLAFRVCHGVLAWEWTTPQPFRVDVSLTGDWRAAAGGDDLSATVDYRAVADAVAGVMTGQTVGLIETLAERIAALLLDLPGVWEASVTVHKPGVDLGVPLDDVAVTVTRRPRRTIVLGLGSNVGDRRRHLQQALEDVQGLGLTIEAVSAVYDTAAVGGTSDYLNAVALAHSDLPPLGVLAVTAECEKRAWQREGTAGGAGPVGEQVGVGVRATWGPRPLDIDILYIAGLRSADPRILLPHPRALSRPFVTVPWAEVQPTAVIDGVAIADLAAAAAKADSGVRRHPDALSLPGHR